MLTPVLTSVLPPDQSVAPRLRLKLVPHQFGGGRGRQVSERRWAVRLSGRGLSGSQLAGHRLVLDWPLREAAGGEGLPADLPELRPRRRFSAV